MKMKNYKRIFIFCVMLTGFFCINAYKARAQYTLTFSQVLTFYGAATTSPATIGTVPSGKVWKVENAMGYWFNGSYDYAADFSFGAGINSNNSLYTASINYGSQANYPKGPIWLKAGDDIKIWRGSSSYPANYQLSVIEFNIQ